MLQILHIDDDSNDLEIIRLNLQRLARDFNITGFESVAKALEYLDNNEVDCIVSDFQMPGMDGLQFLQTLRDNNNKIPFVFLTGQGNESIAAEALRAGADDYFTKGEGLAHYERLALSIRKVIAIYRNELKEREAEKALFGERNFVSAILNTAGALVVVLDNEGRIVRFNKACVDLTGYKVEEVLGKRVWDLFLIEEEIEPVKAVCQRLRSGDFPNKYENYWLTKSGEKHLISWSNTALVSDEGVVEYIIATGLDVTEKVISENIIAENQELLAGISNASPSSIMAFRSIRNDQGDIEDFSWILANPATETIINLNIEEAKGSRMKKLMPSGFIREFFDKFVDVVETGKPLECEHYYKYLGLEIWFHIIAVKLGDGFAVTLTDISKRKEAESELRITKFAMDNANNELFLVGSNGKFVYANKAACEYLGHSQAELQQKYVWETSTSISKENWLERWNWLKENKTLSVETMRRSKTGLSLPVEHNVNYFKFDNEEYAFGLITDISVLKHHQNQLEASKRQQEWQANLLAQTNKELEAFAYTISHDLNAPLHRIRGYSSLLLTKHTEKLDSEGRKILERLDENCADLSELINSILQFSRMTSGVMRREEIDLSQIAGQIISNLGKDAPERQVECVIADGITAEGDPQLLRVVMQNLLNNAWKYTAKEKKARIEFGKKEYKGKTAYYVKDNGCGFDPKFEKELFLPFQRFNKEKDFDGSGIGLATVKRIVHRHGGQVWAEGTQGVGATFFFTLG